SSLAGRHAALWSSGRRRLARGAAGPCCRSSARCRGPTLLIVGGDDEQVVEFNRQAFARLNCAKRMEIVPHASHLFEEPGALEMVARLTAEWFTRHLS